MHDYVTLSMKDQGDKIFSGFNLFVPYKIRIMYLSTSFARPWI